MATTTATAKTTATATKTGTLKLNHIRDNAAATRNRKRVGRGIGSGTGKTAGSGHKGQKARSGVAIKGFEGGQMPIYRRLPKRGFNNIFRKQYAIVNTGRIQEAIDADRLDAKKPVDVAAMQAAGVVGKARDGVRLLAGGEIKAAVHFEVAGASKTAIAAVEKAGGKVKLLAPVKEDAPAESKTESESADTESADAKTDDNTNDGGNT